MGSLLTSLAYISSSLEYSLPTEFHHNDTLSLTHMRTHTHMIYIGRWHLKDM